MSQKSVTEHQSLDLFRCAQQWSELPRFYLPQEEAQPIRRFTGRTTRKTLKNSLIF